jgi:hypothetical protein
MTSSAPRRADSHDSGADSPLPERPLLTTPPNLQPPGVAGQQRQRLASQPWSGHGGLLLTAVVFFALALGTGSTATALLILGPISTFALPAVAMIAFWWNDWPGSRLSVPWTGLIDTALFIAAAIAATIAGQAIVERPDILAVFETAPAPATFPATLPLAGAAFTAMLQLTAGSPAGCRLQGSAPGIFKDMNDIDHDADRAAAAGGFRGSGPAGARPRRRGRPGSAQVLRVAGLGLVERGGDHVRGVPADGPGQPLGQGLRPGPERAGAGPAPGRGDHVV